MMPILRSIPFFLDLTVPNLSALLKEEITRLARKELRKETEALKSASARYRSEIAALKRRVESLEKALARSERSNRPVAPVVLDTEAEGKPLRYSAAGLKKLRARLELSAHVFGQLAGVTGQTVYNWESGSTRPQPEQIQAIAALRTVGKRQLAERLATIPTN